MRRDGLPLLLVFAGAMVFLFAGSFLFAQQAPPTGGSTAALPGEEAESRLTITGEFKNQTLRSICDSISEKSGHSILVAPEAADALVTIKFTAMPWREAVERACDLANCVTRLVDTTIMVEKPPRVTMEFKRAELTEVISLLAKQAGANIVIDKDVKGDVTMRFNDTPWMKALDAVVKTAGYAIVEEDRGRIIRVVTPEKLDTQLESRLFRFKYIKPAETYRAQISSSYILGGTMSPTGGAGGGITQDAVIQSFTLLNALRAMLTKAPGQAASAAGTAAKTLGRLEYFIDQNSILVVDTKPVLDRMAQVIQDLDVEPEQVLTDVTFIQTTNIDFVEIGTDWVHGADHGLTISGEPISRIPNVAGGGLGGTVIQPGGTSVTQYPFNLGSSLLKKGTVESGFFNNYDMTATLRLFTSDRDTEIIQRPNIATRTNVEATIFVGQEIHYASAAVSQVVGSTSTQTVFSEATSSPAKVGFQLFIIPHVITGTNKILMTVIPQNSVLIGTSSTNVAGFNTFGAGSTVPIDLPAVQAETLVTHMLLESGQTMVVGGLMQDRNQKVLTGIPFAKDIPILGWLFKQKQDTLDKQHLFVFITPRIIPGAQAAAAGLAAKDAARQGEIDQNYKWIQMGADKDALQRALQGRQAQNEQEMQKLQGAPAGGGK